MNTSVFQDTSQLLSREELDSESSSSSSQRVSGRNFAYPLALAILVSSKSSVPIYPASNIARQLLTSGSPYRIEVEQSELPNNRTAIPTRAQSISKKYVGVISEPHRRGTFPSEIWFIKYEQKLQELAHLSHNWDSYGAEPPNSLVIERALECLKNLQEINFSPTKITPSVENGIGISFVSGKKYADIEYFNTGEVLAVTSNGQGNPTVWEIDLNEQELKSALDKIRDFLQ
jgi:hypothetical protein